MHKSPSRKVGITSSLYRGIDSYSQESVYSQGTVLSCTQLSYENWLHLAAELSLGSLGIPKKETYSVARKTTLRILKTQPMKSLDWMWRYERSFGIKDHSILSVGFHARRTNTTPTICHDFFMMVCQHRVLVISCIVNLKENKNRGCQICNIKQYWLLHC